MTISRTNIVFVIWLLSFNLRTIMKIRSAALYVNILKELLGRKFCACVLRNLERSIVELKIHINKIY